jgi:hypothetical protein
MTTALQSLSSAYRELNVTAIGISPTAPQQAEGLDQLNRFLRIIFGMKVGELLRDWEAPFQQRTAPVAANFPQNPYPLNQDAQFMGLPLSGGSGNMFWPYPPKNSRIIFGAGLGTTTVFFPEQPDDGSRMGLIMGALADPAAVLVLDGNSRTIGGATTLTVPMPMTGGMRWIYRADIGDWRPVASLLLTDELPFPEDMDDYISLGLAIRLAPKNDKTVSAETVSAFKEAETIFMARYAQAGTTTYGAANIPAGYQSFISGPGWW